jgi:hypothetical protein
MHAVPQQNLREAKNLVEVMPMTFLDIEEELLSRRRRHHFLL